MNNNYKNMMELIYNSTYIENVNNGVAPQTDYFGAKITEGMAYSKDALYNKQKNNTFHADMTKPQSHYMNPKQGTK
tara:strand:+ start:733 stop:960 length:228 start_codon:yes stop_codon:yes gene_type:complete